jgi:hypothetical protein
MVRDQEVDSSNPLAPTNTFKTLYNSCPQLSAVRAFHLAGERPRSRIFAPILLIRVICSQSLPSGSLR